MASIDLRAGVRLRDADRAATEAADRAATDAADRAAAEAAERAANEPWPSVDLASRRGTSPAVEDAGEAYDEPVQEPEPHGEPADEAIAPDETTPVVEATAEPLVEPGEPAAADAVDAEPAAEAEVEAPSEPAAPDVEPAAPVAAPAHDPRKPSTLLADLTTAMRATALGARDQALAQVEQDAAVAVETIRATSVETAKTLRHRADDDVEGIREWTKAEIARIRSESETRMAQRRTELDEELAAEAESVEQHVFDVHDALARYQAEMAAFFERLVAESDAARLATMAETMPEPPVLAAPVPDTETGHRSRRRREAPVLSAEAAAVDEANGDEAAGDPTTTVAAQTLAAEPETEEPGTVAEDEPLADLVDVPDSAVAEADVAAAVTDEPAPREDGRSFAERLAGLLPHRSDDAAEGEPQTTQVIVTGLASVASIASFKRQLGRVTGVTSVSVSSGPDGEFVFNAVHRPSAHLTEAIPALQGFGATVTRTGDGVVFVAAQDPDSES